MDDITIANSNNFRQLIDIIKTNRLSHFHHYQVVSPIGSLRIRLQENSKCIIIIFDTEGGYLYYNVSSKYNLTEDDLPSGTDSDIFDIKIGDERELGKA